jgi:hypothetical protein
VARSSSGPAAAGGKTLSSASRLDADVGKRGQGQVNCRSSCRET